MPRATVRVKVSGRIHGLWRARLAAWLLSTVSVEVHADGMLPWRVRPSFTITMDHETSEIE